MKVIFGLAFDHSYFPLASRTQINEYFLGPTGLLKTLENYLGLSGHRNDIAFLRVEQFRQLIIQVLKKEENPFYKKAFEADQFACAEELLDRRDELKMSGFDFKSYANAPTRIRQLIALEQVLQANSKLRLSPGIADRLETLIQLIPQRQLPFKTLIVVEPISLLPPVYQRLLQTLKKAGVDLLENSHPPRNTKGDLAKFQQLLSTEENGKISLNLEGDGSLLILKGKRDTELATFLAGMVRKNEFFNPVLLLPGSAPVVDTALIQQGLPGLGIQAASLSRPPLQLLKLASSFLWAPLDPYKILEFVSLSVQPIEQELANRIAQHIAQYPGVRSDSWKSMIAQYFRALETESLGPLFDKTDQIRYTYRFWFERDQYDANGKAPKAEALQLYSFLHQWASKLAEEAKTDYDPLQILAEKAKQVIELLEELPEQELSRLDLERVVRTINEPATLQLNERQQGALNPVKQSNGIWGPCPQLAWWNFIQQEPDYFFSRWYKAEIDFLNAQGLFIEGPKKKNERLIWQRKQAILWTQKQLILLCPELVEGQAALAHPLMGDMEASLSKLEAISFDIANPEDRLRLQQHFQLLSTQAVHYIPKGQPQAFLKIEKALNFSIREAETITSLETLLYYPYQWVFKYLLKLRKSPILSIVEEATLQGNLAHRLLEKLLSRPDVYDWDATQLDQWILKEAKELFEKEGAVLLLYGKEPLKIGFTKKVQYAARSLLAMLKNNNWQVEAIEKELEGNFADTLLKGRADLILKRNKEWAILDLKWRGIGRRKQMLKNLEDLQLILYAHLWQKAPHWAHTAYYIIEKGTLLARNMEAFEEISPIAPDLDRVETYEMVLEKMEKTYFWRLNQLKKGWIEVRCTQTIEILEEHYEDLLSLLEMKNDNAPFDDYQTLVNLIQ